MEGFNDQPKVTLPVRPGANFKSQFLPSPAPSEAEDTSAFCINISLPQDLLGPKKGLETRKEIKKAIKSCRNDDVFEGSFDYRQCRASSHFLCSFRPLPSTSLILLFLLCSQSGFTTIFTFHSVSIIPLVVLSSFHIYVDLMHVTTLQCLPQLIPFRVHYFDLFWDWLDFIVK